MIRFAFRTALFFLSALALLGCGRGLAPKDIAPPRRAATGAASRTFERLISVDEDLNRLHAGCTTADLHLHDGYTAACAFAAYRYCLKEIGSAGFLTQWAGGDFIGVSCVGGATVRLGTVGDLESAYSLVNAGTIFQGGYSFALEVAAKLLCEEAFGSSSTGFLLGNNATRANGSAGAVVYACYALRVAPIELSIETLTQFHPGCTKDAIADVTREVPRTCSAAADTYCQSSGHVTGKLSSLPAPGASTAFVACFD